MEVKERGEAAKAADFVDLVRQEQEFQPQLVRLLAKNPNAGMIEGLATLALYAQRDLYTTGGLNRGDVGRDIDKSNGEMGARVVATLLDRMNVGIDYEVGNLGGWLGSKGLGVERFGEEREIHWSKGRSGFGGQREKELYFEDDELSLGGTVVILDYLAAKSLEMAAKHIDFEDDVRVLTLAGAVAKTVSLEIRSLVATGKPLTKEAYQALLEKPLGDIGVKLVEKS